MLEVWLIAWLSWQNDNEQHKFTGEDTKVIEELFKELQESC